jgi:hypothetical protein
VVGLGWASLVSEEECLEDWAFFFFFFLFSFCLLWIGLRVFLSVLSHHFSWDGDPYVEPVWIGKESGKLDC